MNIIKNMIINDYQKEALKTARYPKIDYEHTYLVMGLTGEAGEVSEAFKKLYRDHDGVMTNEYRVKIAKELGDVLWYVSVLADRLGYSLEEIAEINNSKLRERYSHML